MAQEKYNLVRRCSRLVPNPDGPEAYSLCHLIEGHDDDHRAWNPRTGGMLTARPDLDSEDYADVMVGDSLFDLARQMAGSAFTQTLNLHDLIKPGSRVQVEVSCIPEYHGDDT